MGSEVRPVLEISRAKGIFEEEGAKNHTEVRRGKWAGEKLLLLEE